MSFFDRQGISECLLQDQNKRGTDNETLKENTENENELESNINDNNNSIMQCYLNDNFEVNILTLRNYSFILVSVDGSSFEMYRLV